MGSEDVIVHNNNFQLEFAKKGVSCQEDNLSNGWGYREVHTTAPTASDAFNIEPTANFTNEDPTADGDGVSLTNTDPVFVAGQGIDTSSSTSAITLDGNGFTEIEYAIKANSNAQFTTDYCFRLTDGGSSRSFTYTVYPELQTGTASTPTPEPEQGEDDDILMILLYCSYKWSDSIFNRRRISSRSS